MREEIANRVYPILDYGMGLKERLERGDQPDFDREQAELNRLLLTEVEARRYPEFAGEGGLERSIGGSFRTAEGARRGPEPFLGIRYALVCWLDELFILYTDWSTRWNERRLEEALFHGSNERAWKFWEQARLAEAQSGSDALEVFYLCALLGFRGDLREEPSRLKAWVAGTQIRITRSQELAKWSLPPERVPPSYVPPLSGRQRLQKVIWTAGALLLVGIPVLAFLFVYRFGQ
jgi:type VI secretion system protein ImpK